MISSRHRPTVAQVDLEAISANLHKVVHHLPRSAKVFAVVKANAYGHGSLAVAHQLAPDVDGFCVSNLDEALELREAGLTQMILILGVVPVDCMELAAEQNISLPLASLEWLQMVLDRGLDVTGVHFHIKIDSGMGRIGFRHQAEVLEAISVLQEKGAVLEGIFTHFATADEANTTQFDQQLANFQSVLANLPSLPPYVHASNSAASIWHADTVFNAVRLGDVLYGLNPSGHLLEMPYAIQPAFSLTSELVHVKQLAAGDTVGYGATYQAADGEWIGTVPIGYADGLQRRLQGFSVLVDGQFCEIVGRVSMDQITIQLPKAYPIGTQVTLIGQDGDNEITVQDWADEAETINYEVMCLLSDRIPRIY